jgi:hypothetical protein
MLEVGEDAPGLSRSNTSPYNERFRSCSMHLGAIGLRES